MSVHTAIGSNVKRLWVCYKNLLKMSKLRITVLKLFQNLEKISSKIFFKTDRYIWLFSCHLLEISDYTVVPKNISKICEKFLQNGQF